MLSIFFYFKRFSSDVLHCIVINLLYLVQSLSLLTTSSTSVSYEPSESRKRRWCFLNEILDEVVSKSKKLDKSSVPFSSISWELGGRGFHMENLVLTSRDVPDEVVDTLHGQLMNIHSLFGGVMNGKQGAKMRQFISPILIAVCVLLPEVTISVEEDMRGVHIHANGRFEYVINYRQKKVCIVEAKKDDMEQGQIQSLIGCEVVADIEKCSMVYAIVTNYIQWLFYKNTDDRTYYSDISLTVIDNVPDKGSLREVAKRIYGMLTEIEDTPSNIAENT